MSPVGPDVLWNTRISRGHYIEACTLLDHAPPLLQQALLERYARIAGPHRRFYCHDGRVLDTYNDSLRDLSRTAGALRQAHVRTAFDDDLIESAADRAARYCMAVNLPSALGYARAQGLTLPNGPRVTSKGLRRRLVSPDWWRRRLRQLLTRRAEAIFRALGFVRAGASAYISADAKERIRQASVKSQRWIQQTAAVCQDTGTVVELEKIARGSLANPAIRRGELMTRARGFQEVAQDSGHRCLMVTLTCPSAFHAYLHTGEANPRYNGTTPREAQRWLCERWARARVAFKRKNLLVYGWRVAEPHHEGCPHWHMVLYAPPGELWRIRVILRRLWLQQYRDEPGAARHRVRFTMESPAKGSGVGYLAKYVGKNVDGYGSIGAESSDESGRAVSDDAAHAVAWARCWGIRQFQQVGGPAVTAWRELRRVREPCDCPPLESLRLTTDHSAEGGPSWARFIGRLGGIAASLKVSRELLDRAEPRVIDSMGRRVLRLTRWGELPAATVVGLKLVYRDRIRRLATRVHVWFLIFAPPSALGPVAITVSGAPRGGERSAWTNPLETSRAGPHRGASIH